MKPELSHSLWIQLLIASTISNIILATISVPKMMSITINYSVLMGPNLIYISVSVPKIIPTFHSYFSEHNQLISVLNLITCSSMKLH